jgi:hypothetical protein
VYSMLVCYDCGREFQWRPSETGGHLRPNGYEMCLGRVWEIASFLSYYSPVFWDRIP